MLILQFMMNIELQMDNPKRREAYWSALTMGLAYFFGILSHENQDR